MRGAPRSVDVNAERVRIWHALADAQRVLGRATAAEGVYVEHVRELVARYLEDTSDLRKRLRQLRRVERRRRKTDEARAALAEWKAAAQ